MHPSRGRRRLPGERGIRRAAVELELTEVESIAVAGRVDDDEPAHETAQRGRALDVEQQALEVRVCLARLELEHLPLRKTFARSVEQLEIEVFREPTRAHEERHRLRQIVL